MKCSVSVLVLAFIYSTSIVLGQGLQTSGPIAVEILDGYLASLPKGMFYESWQVIFGNKHNSGFMSFRASEGCNGEWKFSPSDFDWLRVESNGDIRTILSDSDGTRYLFESRESKEKGNPTGGIAESVSDIGIHHERRLWWPLWLQELKNFGMVFTGVEVQGDYTLLNYKIAHQINGVIEVDNRDGFKITRISESCTEALPAGCRHDWTFENDSIVVGERKYWFPKKSKMFCKSGNYISDLTLEHSGLTYSATVQKPVFVIPDGTHVSDRVRRVEYVQGGGNRTVNEIADMLGPDDATSPDLRGRHALNRTWWLYAFILLVVGVAVGILSLRRKQK